jgi:hypothetical protein
MISDKQLQANRHNAQLGGVKTEAGKAISRFNAQKHAILSLSLTSYDEKLDYEAFIDELSTEYGSPTGLKGILIERAALCYIKLHRVQKAEGEYIRSVLEPEEYDDFTADIRILVKKGYQPQFTTEGIEKLTDIYGRYETTLENRLFRILRQLEDLKAPRAMVGGV